MQETSDEYRKRIIGYTEGRDPLKLQAAAPKKLEALLKGASPSILHRKPAPGKWSIAEIVAHLADTELVAGYRIRAILGEPGTSIIGFDQDAWAAALHYEKHNVQKSFEQYCACRMANLALLKMITPKQWNQFGIHSERGKESVKIIVRMYAGHDINHFRQIERILE